MNSFLFQIFAVIFAIVSYGCKPSPKQLIALGDEKKTAHDYQGAITDYSSALTEEPGIYQAWQNRGECQMRLGAYESAINDFQEVLKLKPKFSAALYNMGLCFLELRKYREALQCIEKAASTDTCIDANTALAECYFYAGKNQTAIKYFNAAIQETPDSAGLFLGRALANYQLGLTLQSKSDLTTYLQKGGVNSVAYRQLGLIYLKTAVTKELADTTILFLEKHKSEVQKMDGESSKALLLAYFLRGKIQMASEKQIDALADFSRIIELDPSNADALLERGKILISVGQNIEGCMDLQNALKNGNAVAEKLIAIYCKDVL